MAILIRGVFLTFFATVFSAPMSLAADPPPSGNCESFEVYRKTVEYLIEKKELPFTETQILSAALEINKGCDGADKRFKKIFELLLKSGIEIKKCYDLSVKFAQMNDSKTDNFAVLFKGLFLENKFDLDFMTSFKVSLELSAALPSDWEKIQTDFKKFLDFCLSSKSDDLPLRACGEWTLALLKNEHLYPNGIYSSFASLNDYLTKRKGPQVLVKERLKLVKELLAYGPKGPENFQKSLDWLTETRKAALPEAKAYSLALSIAKNSLKQDEATMTKDEIENP